MNLPKPSDKEDMYLNYLASGQGKLPIPTSKKHIYLDYIAKNGSMGGGGANHTHANKVVLDSITQNDLNNLNELNEVVDNVEGSYLSLSGTKNGNLKNVEIKGNTVQNPTNLSDIKSVGKKLENQDLYEIPLLSVGKNLCNMNISVGMIGASNGELNASVDTYFSDVSYTKIDKEKPIVLSCDKIIETAFFYDCDKKFISNLSIGYTVKAVSPPSNACYIRMRFLKEHKPTLIQIEYGTTATPYEPFQSNKITILSPCQIEKVGDIADGIIEKNGVWGVEKNIVDYVINQNTIFERRNDVDTSSTERYSFQVSNLVPGKNILSTKLKSLENLNVDNSTGIIGHSNIDRIDIKRLKTDNSFTDVSSLKTFLIGSTIKFPTTKPQFVPLPHDQQILLKTFVNKTNISFLTEVEGTIKAQVPKSIKATVNTHTSQIENIYDELDRVKKLEESTVSTVTTDKDFANVQATSNGYFEDVKLSGKTLVNKFVTSKALPSSVSKNGSEFSTSTDSVQVISDLINISSDACTLVYSIKTPTPQTHADFNALFRVANENGVTFDGFKGSVDNNYKLICQVINTKNKDKIKIELRNACSVKDIVILEGDYTQNQPSYFEGLKSVGDGADEIVVSSVDGDGNLFDGYFDTSISNRGITDIRLQSGRTYDFKFDVDSSFGSDPTISICSSIVNGLDIKDTILKTQRLEIGENIITNVSNKTDGVLTIYFNTNGNKTKAKLVQVSESKNSFIPLEYKADKKRILYYDPTDNTWKKPVLREWDTIEKHSDGKYYYHQRSLEENYISGDESKADCITDMTKTVKKLAQEKVFECTNIDLITYANETNYVFNGGVISPRTSLKVHSNISNVVSLLQKKVSVIEERFLNHVIIQNRLQLASTYGTDSVTFKVDYNSKSVSPLDNDLYNLIKKNILVGKDNYDYDTMCTMLLDYASWKQITWEQYDELMTLIETQQHPKEEANK